MSHHLIQWFPGKPGKGWLLGDGRVLCWNTSGRGTPHHYDRFLECGGRAEEMPRSCQQGGGWIPNTGIAVPFLIDAEGVVTAATSNEPLDAAHMRRIRSACSELTAPRLAARRSPQPV